MSTRRVLVIAAGDCEEDKHNDPGRQLLSRLQDLPVARHWWLTLIGESQFQLEHAMDLQINDLAIFVHSAAQPRAEPFSFRRVTRPEGYRISTTTQSLSPADVLHALSTISRRDFLPLCFELDLHNAESHGALESEQTVIDEALVFLDKLLANTDPQNWEDQEVA